MKELHLELRHLKKTYTRPVLVDVNLEVTNDSYVTIVGKSGSGKSTMLNILGLLENCSGGEYIFNGIPIVNGVDYSRLRLENIGFIFQSYNLIPTLSCKENILLPLLYNKHNAVQDFDELVELLDLQPLLSQRVNTLSGGEKQRVAIARALILDPCLILADEPTGNLDPKNRDLIMQLLRREHEKGRGVILITHDMEVARSADTIYLLQDGMLQTVDSQSMME
ncbi:MAG TPA: ABC transporter ATP-binding protein [Candidatus Faecousia excrementigallinarum]|uniref:ABC transporter ATP-binding protein n=1 Tax=Candidatus Faecousia excrementigallinarum TaxID=2840806 RepID=A0A9D0Z150_9FIRM|nr:ABC transporter ATP-binding protein [Candidatus Faecousia excrementigallinarum]